MNRHILAYGILIFSTLAITCLAVFTIVKNPSEAKDIFNVVLPVFASWVGTVLAFYFGKENFESANQQALELVERLTPEQRAKASVTSIMRHLVQMTYFSIPQGQDDQNVNLSDLRKKFGDNVSRLPIIDADKKAKYMIHESRIDNYIATGGNQEDTLETFIIQQKQNGFDFSLNKGFVVVSEQTSLAGAKRKMEDIPSCQDIFITKDGSPDEQLTGWISNVRMAKFLEV